MTNIFIPDDLEPFYKRYLLFFTGTTMLTLGCFVISFLLFPLQAGLISVFFASFSLIPSMEAILEKNKKDIWEERLKPTLANLDMVCALMVIFFAAFFSYGLIVNAIPNGTLEKIFFSQIHDTMTHTHLLSKEFSAILNKRLAICGIFFLVSLIFRVGFVFVLVWLASVWGVVYGLFVKQGFQLDIPSLKHYMIIVSISGFFTLLIRTVSFITASMAGVFFSKAVGKYSWKSPQFKQVFRAVLAILLVSVLLLLASVCWEYHMYNS